MVFNCLIIGRQMLVNGEYKKEFEMCFKRGIAVLSMKVPTLQLDEYKEILKSLDVTENFDNAIYDIYKKRSGL